MPKNNKLSKLEKTEDISSDSEVDSNKEYKMDKPEDTTIQVGKRLKTEAQIKAFEKARLKRAENILKRQEERKKDQEEFHLMKEMKKQIKELKTQKKQAIELKKYETDSESEPEPEIIVKRKTTKKKPKVIYIDDDDEKDEKNIIIVNKTVNPNTQPHQQTMNVRQKPRAIFL